MVVMMSTVAVMIRGSIPGTAASQENPNFDKIPFSALENLVFGFEGLKFVHLWSYEQLRFVCFAIRK
jgi:hypothetical protein